jgi:hypothetical protein
MQIHIIDMDDGPDGGGGAALSAALSVRGINHRVWVDDALSSGWPHNTDHVEVSWISNADSLGKISSKALVIAGTRGAINGASKQNTLPTSLKDMLKAPRYLDALDSALESDIKTVPFALLVKTTDLEVMEKTFLASHLLYPDGEMASVSDGGDAWLKIERAARGNRLPVAAVGGSGAQMFQLAIVTRGRRCRASIALRVDQAYSAWRVAFGRVVCGKHWDRLADDAARLMGQTGIYTVWATILSGDDLPQFITARPTPPDWLSVAGTDGGILIDALIGSKDSTCRKPAAQTVYSAIPIDTPVTTETLLGRMPAND